MATLRQQWTKLTRTLGPETPEFLLLSTHTAESLVPGLGIAFAEGSLPRRVTAHSYAVVPHALEQLSRSSERPAEVAVLGDFEGLFGHAPQDIGFDHDLRNAAGQPRRAGGGRHGCLGGAARTPARARRG